MGKAAPKPHKKHITCCGEVLGALCGAFAASAAMIELVLHAKSITGDLYTIKFPSCNNQFFENACISPLLNLQFAICAYAFVTFLMSLVCLLIPFRLCFPAPMQALEPFFTHAPSAFLLVLGVLVFGMAGVVGFAAGICCFISSFLFAIIFFL